MPSAKTIPSTSPERRLPGYLQLELRQWKSRFRLGFGLVTVDWANAGNETVTLIVNQNGCRDTSTFNVRVNPIPNSTLSLPTLLLAKGLPCRLPTRGHSRSGRHLQLDVHQRYRAVR